VSRFHAEIRREAGRYRVRDLGSTNGTLVAEQPVDESELREGDTISLGGYPLTFRQLE
jgi:pSer/pThr/pTyr-binding forkhead associated (FHA) protein